jgi:prepilin peptidase CpaA
MPYHVAWLVALTVALLAAILDGRTGRIPDRLTVGMLAAAPVAHAAAAYVADPTAMTAVQAALASVLGAAAGGVLPYLLLRAGGIGGGDVKLFLAVGAIAGVSFAVHAVTYAMLLALAQGLLLVARRRALRSTGRNVLALFKRPLRRNAETPLPTMTTMRLALSIFLGTCVATVMLWDRSG